MATIYISQKPVLMKQKQELASICYCNYNTYFATINAHAALTHFLHILNIIHIPCIKHIIHVIPTKYT